MNAALQKILEYFGADPTGANAVQSIAPFGFTGMAMPWFAAKLPEGFLALDGSIKKKIDYPALSDLLGATWNTGGEASDEFRLPLVNDDRMLMGRSAANVGTRGGANQHQHLTAIGFDGNVVYTYENGSQQPIYGSDVIATTGIRSALGTRSSGPSRLMRTSTEPSLPQFSGVQWIIKT